MDQSAELDQATESCKREAQEKRVACLNEIGKMKSEFESKIAAADIPLSWEVLDEYHLANDTIDYDYNRYRNDMSKYQNVLSDLIQERARILETLNQIQLAKRSRLEPILEQSRHDKDIESIKQSLLKAQEQVLLNLRE